MVTEMSLRVRDPRADINAPPEGKRIRRLETMRGYAHGPVVEPARLVGEVLAGLRARGRSHAASLRDSPPLQGQHLERRDARSRSTSLSARSTSSWSGWVVEGPAPLRPCVTRSTFCAKECRRWRWSTSRSAAGPHGGRPGRHAQRAALDLSARPGQRRDPRAARAKGARGGRAGSQMLLLGSASHDPASAAHVESTRSRT